MLFLTAILCHFHVTPFATRDAFIIPATLSPNGMDIFVVPPQRVAEIDSTGSIAVNVTVTVHGSQDCFCGRQA